MQVGARGGALRALGEGAAAVLDVEVRCAAHAARTLPAARRLLRRSRSQRARRARSRRTLLGVDLAPGQVHVGLADQPPLVGGQRHPLGEHVVGVGQPGAAVGPRVVRERDAVLVEQLAGRRARRRRSACAGRSGRRTGAGRAVSALAEPAPHAQEAELAVHRPVVLVDARAQQLARALLGAAFAAGVIADRRAGAPARRPQLARPRRARASASAGRAPTAARRARRGGAEREPSAASASRGCAAGGAREEDHALGVAGNLVEALDELGLAASAGSARSAPPPTCPASSSRRNASISSRSCSGTSTSPSASTISP